MLPALAVEAIVGRGGRGMAGGGEGKEAVEELFRKLEVKELERSKDDSWAPLFLS